MADKKKDKKDETSYKPLIPESWMPWWRAGTFIAFLVCCWYWFDGPQWWAKQFPPSAPKTGSGVSTPLPVESSKPSDPRYPEEDGNIFFGDGCEVVELEIFPDRWSKQVVTPVDAREYRFSGGPGAYRVRFLDGYERQIDENSVEPFGVRRGIFRFRGTASGQKVKVAIKK